jgi:transposase
MTTKQIAEAVGKPVRTVQDWVKELGAKSALISAKSASSSPMYPTDYTLSEVCQIIEEGMGKAAADVYRTNAVNAEMVKPAKTKHSAAYIREVRLTLGKDAAARLLAGDAGAAPAPQPLALPGPAMEWPEGIPRKLQQTIYAVLVSGLKKAAKDNQDKKNTPELF